MKLKYRRVRREKRGSALILSMIVITSLGILSLAFLQGSLQTDCEVVGRVDDARGNMLIEAAFTEGLAALSAGYVGGVGTIDAPATFGDGLFWVEATDLGDGHTRLYATAMVGKARVSQELVAKVDPQVSDFDIQGVISQGDITLWPNVMIDSYDPALGNYDSQPKKKNGSGDEYVGAKGTIVTNGSVSMKPGSAIMGDLIVGPGESPDTGKGEVDGAVSNNDALVVFGLPKLPNLASAGDLNASGGSLGPGVYRYDDVVIDHLAIQGPATIICDSLEISGDAMLNINATDGGVNFMVLGDFSTTSQEDFQVNTNAPSDLRFFLYDSVNIHTGPSDTLFGLFYAPNSTFDLAPKTEVFGAIVCEDLRAAPKCKFHFDESFLGDVISIIGLPNVSRVYWAEADLPELVRQAPYADPFAALGVDRAELATASESWDMTYRPLDDQYTGESMISEKEVTDPPVTEPVPVEPVVPVEPPVTDPPPTKGNKKR